jgi:hypothetical protein
MQKNGPPPDSQMKKMDLHQIPNAKKRLMIRFPSEKNRLGYVISERVCNFRNPYDFWKGI